MEMKNTIDSGIVENFPDFGIYLLSVVGVHFKRGGLVVLGKWVACDESHQLLEE